ncbi:MAG: Tetratricopeptide repeat-containing protein [Bacteroidetes bacterium]|nr:Tetratricopeptide repeat-containing protein [Bacteroidota bacterium]
MSNRSLVVLSAAMLFLFSLLTARQSQLEKGVQLAMAGKYEEAKRVYEDILKADEKNAAAHFRLGLLLLRRFQNVDDATDHLEEAVELSPDNADYHFGLGQAYGETARNAGIFKKAIVGPKVKTEFEKAAQLNPKHVGAHIGLAQFYSQAPGIMGGSDEKAWKEVETVIALDEYEGHRLKAQILEREKKIEAAEQEWKSFAGLRPGDWRVWKLSGYFFLRQKKSDAAIAAFDKYVELRPDTADSHDSLAEAFIEKNDYDKAEASLKKALSLDKDFKYSVERLARVYELKGRKQEARETYHAVKPSQTVKLA